MSWQDPYLVPGTDCLANKAGIRDPEKLHEAEYLATAIRETTLRDIIGPKPAFDFETLKAVHKHLFQDVYAWAGQVRSVNIAKGGTAFEPAQLIEPAGRYELASLQKNNYLKGLTAGQFAERLAHYFTKINEIHPFREGNGRAQKAFCSLLAEHAGYRLDWSAVSRDRYIEASRQGCAGNQAPLIAVIQACL